MKRLALLMIPIAVVGLILVRQTPVPDRAAKAAETARLEAVLPLFDELGVRAYRDTADCHSIEYTAGSFETDPTGTACDVVDPNGIPFSEAAENAFDRVRTALAATGVAVFSAYEIEAYEPESGGNGRQIVFDLVERAPGRWAYIYEPGHSVADRNGQVVINDRWFFRAWEPGIQ